VVLMLSDNGIMIGYEKALLKNTIYDVKNHALPSS
jgi:hypothetical protein